MFHKGQLVVCLLNEWEKRVDDPPNLVFPVKDIIYTIRDAFTLSNILALRFEEIYNPVFGGCEMGFRSKWFRPIVKPSIESIRKLLVNPPKELALEK